MNTPNPINESIIQVSKKIIDIAKDRGIDYIDACVSYCEENDLEIEYLGEIIEKNQHLKAMIQKEAEDLHYLKRSSRLFGL